MNQFVSVIIPAYNAENWIARSINSALGEPEVKEVLVVDDASPDKTVSVAKSCDDGTGRLMIIQQPKNLGPSAARNKALEKASGEWIAILDSDDFFLPGRTKKLIDFSDQADLIADDLWQVPESNIDGPRQHMLYPPIDTPQEISLERFVLSNVTRRGRERQELGFIKPLIRNRFLKEHNLYYKEHLRLGEDYDLYVRALACGARLVLLPPQGYISVVRANSLSGMHSEHDLEQLRNCNQEIMSTYNLKEAEKKALREHYRNTDCRLQWRRLITAVKTRSITAALMAFMRPWPVPGYLVRQLCMQAYLRSFKSTRNS